MEDKYELDPVAAKLVRDGVITLSVVFTQSGIDCWARSVQSHPRLGVYPHESLELADLKRTFGKHASIRELERNENLTGVVSSHTTGFPAKNSILQSGGIGLTLRPYRDLGEAQNLVAKRRIDSTQFDVMAEMDVSSAKRLISQFNLDTVKRSGGATNSLPVDSITGFDLKRTSPMHLFARMVAVAAKLGNSVINGRVTTQRELYISGRKDLHSWWDSASNSQRLRVLSNQKKLDITRLSTGEHPLLSVVSELPSPFRGSAEDIQSESDEEFKIFDEDD